MFVECNTPKRARIINSIQELNEFTTIFTTFVICVRLLSRFNTINLLTDTKPIQFIELSNGHLTVIQLTYTYTQDECISGLTAPSSVHCGHLQIHFMVIA